MVGRFVLAIIIAVSGTASLGDAQWSAPPAPNGQWSMFMNGPLRHGWTPAVGAQSSHLTWRIPTETNGGGPVIGRDGTIYQGTDYGQLLAIRPNGTTKWILTVPRYRVNSTPAILQDGRIAFVDEGGTIYVVNPDGTPSWKYDTGTPCGCDTDPAIGVDGTIYTGIDQTVYAFHPDGSIRWTYQVGQSITGSVAVRPDGVVYFPSGYLVALNPNGTLLWHSADYLGLGGAPAIGNDGTIYVNAHDPVFYAFDADGNIKWSYRAGDCCGADVPSSPAIGPDGTIYVGETVLDDGMMLALTPAGSVLWAAHHGAYPTAPAIGGDGLIYFGTNSPASVYALRPNGTLRWRYDDSGYVRTPPAVGLGRRVYSGSLTGLFGIGPDR
ncbi:MAG TPA: PQQ-binding-like beta-propeller repeat protein [Actinomycetota bacterium]|nr:PQQ-binding-like beta-propeller repeat protein [Actinomycetota bacterium]